MRSGMTDVGLPTLEVSSIGVSSICLYELAKELHPNFDLVTAAPISAVSWYLSKTETDTDRYLRIRIYTVLKSKRNEISELSFQGRNGWDSDVSDATNVGIPHVSNSQPPGYSGVAAARDTKAKKEDPIYVFYQLRPNVIDLKSMPAEDENEYKEAAESVERPQGIPTSRGLFTDQMQQGGSTTQIPDLTQQPNSQPVPTTATGISGDHHQPQTAALDDDHQQQPDAKVVVSASNNEEAWLWDFAAKPVEGRLEGHSGKITGVAFSPDGKLLASAATDKTVRLWDSASGALRGMLLGHPHPICGVAFSPDSKMLACGVGAKAVGLWDSAKRKASLLMGHSGSIYAVAFSPDGKLLASAASDSTIRLWDPATGAAARTLEGHSGISLAVAFSPDGKLLASTASDTTIRLWDPATGRMRCSLWVIWEEHVVGISPERRQRRCVGRERADEIRRAVQ